MKKANIWEFMVIPNCIFFSSALSVPTISLIPFLSVISINPEQITATLRSCLFPLWLCLISQGRGLQVSQVKLICQHVFCLCDHTFHLHLKLNMSTAYFSPPPSCVVSSSLFYSSISRWDKNESLERYNNISSVTSSFLCPSLIVTNGTN